jgi:hypothetical protein
MVCFAGIGSRLLRERLVGGYAAGDIEAVTGPARPTAEAPAPPDPFTDADALDDLADEITTLAAHIHAATHRLLVLLADFDRRRGWELGGHRSCAHWLAVRTGIDLGAARERVRAARALVHLPETGAAMSRGELSFAQVRALTRVATPENEADLLPFAVGSTAAQLERLVRGFRRGSRLDEARREEELHRSRSFSLFPDDEGMMVVRGRLPADVGALVMKALEAADDALFRQRGPGPLNDPEETRAESARRRADALALLAERAMGVGFEGPISGSRAERYQVILHVEPETLRAPDPARDGSAGDGEASDPPPPDAPRSHLHDGTRVSAETSRRHCCDAGLVRVTHAADGSLLDVGRRTRTIPPALRRALEVRDRGCRFPRCGARFTDAHHVTHWADGGATSLDNCLLLCRHHHRLVHEGGWSIEWWGTGQPTFRDPRGQLHFDGSFVPGREATGADPDPVTRLLQDHRSRGITPGPATAAARWRHEENIPTDVYLRAREAVP